MPMAARKTASTAKKAESSPMRRWVAIDPAPDQLRGSHLGDGDIGIDLGDGLADGGIRAAGEPVERTERLPKYWTCCA